MLSQESPTNIIKGDDVKRDILKSYVSVLKSVNGDALKLKFIDTPVGTMIAVSDDTHLLLLDNVQSKHLDRDMKNLVKTHSKSLTEGVDAIPLQSIEFELNAYFRGELTEFKTNFHFDINETDFQRLVWNEIYKIPFGETSSYSKLAEAIGKPKSYRAVANACGRNPIAILVPCHRVLAAGEALGGYSSGVDKKVFLLSHEKQFK